MSLGCKSAQGKVAPGMIQRSSKACGYPWQPWERHPPTRGRKGGEGAKHTMSHYTTRVVAAWPCTAGMHSNYCEHWEERGTVWVGLA